jgi:pimeloyl-ACP methyl ester carboxylesterase
VSTPNSTGLSFSPIRARSRLRTVFVVLLACVALSALAGAFFELLATRRIGANNPPAGRLVNISGRKNHIFCLGSGSPTVIFISGLGETYGSWSKVQPRVAQSTRTCSYDRAGLGWSDRPQEPRDVLLMATELHDLLAASDLKPPYLLVGHSLGGGIARVFDGQYPHEVAGMVFVDAVPAGFLSRLQPDAWDANMSRTAHRMRWLAPLGIARLQGKCQVDNRPFIHCSDFWATFTAEREALPTSVRQIAGVQSIGDTPLRILSRDTDPAVGWGSPENRLAWEEMQEDLAKLSTRSRQTIVKGATHYIQDDQPDAVIEAISGMLMSLRNQPK